MTIIICANAQQSITILQANQTVHDISMSKKEHKTVCVRTKCLFVKRPTTIIKNHQLHRHIKISQMYKSLRQKRQKGQHKLVSYLLKIVFRALWAPN